MQSTNGRYFTQERKDTVDREVVSDLAPEMEVKPPLTHVQLHDALMYIQDALERAQVPFMLLGDLAQQIYEQDIPVFHADKVEVGVELKHWTKSCQGIFNMIIREADLDGTKVMLSYKGVPIEIVIIGDTYPFFKYPDVRFYTLTELRLPNPFEAYWFNRDRVK